MSNSSKKLNVVAKTSRRTAASNTTYVNSLLYYRYEGMRECISQVERMLVKVLDLEMIGKRCWTTTVTKTGVSTLRMTLGYLINGRVRKKFSLLYCSTQTFL